MALTYTTRQKFEAYVPGWVTDNADALEKLLGHAERDIDRLLGNRIPLADTGLKLDPSPLPQWAQDALSNAVCAQAEYLFTLGPDALIKPAAKRIKGPDFEIEHDAGGAGAQPSYGRKALNELEPLRRYLTPRGARARP